LFDVLTVINYLAEGYKLPINQTMRKKTKCHKTKTQNTFIQIAEAFTNTGDTT
jgi:hypothetical protein